MSLREEIKHIYNNAEYSFMFSRIIFDNFLMMTLDNKYEICRIEHPPSLMVINTIEKEENLNLEDIMFYSDYFSYVHEVPVYFKSTNEKTDYPIKSLIHNEQFDNNEYYEKLSNIYEEIVSIKLNGFIKFKWSNAFLKKININILKEKLYLKKEIQLYSMALKQSDPLSEFLCYYRILESVLKKNGKEWINKNIYLIEHWDFGDLDLISSLDLSYGNTEKSINIFELYRERAIMRINVLFDRLGKGAIGHYLYNEIRCGIAHGKENIKIHDNGKTLKEISEDLYIMKLLARIAIEDKNI